MNNNVSLSFDEVQFLFTDKISFDDYDFLNTQISYNEQMENGIFFLNSLFHDQ